MRDRRTLFIPACIVCVLHVLENILVIHARWPVRRFYGEQSLIVASERRNRRHHALSVFKGQTNEIPVHETT